MAKYVIDGATLTGIADELRRMAGPSMYTPSDMIEALKTIDPDGKFQEGYDQGVKEEHDAFWDAFQNNGARVSYDYAFWRWQDTGIFYPKHDIKPTNINKMCQYFGDQNDPLDIAARFQYCGIIFDSSKATNVDSAFYWTGGIKRIPETSTVGANSLYTFCHNCSNLETIDKIILKSDGSQVLDTAFTQCPKLKNITFEGVIGYNNVDFSQSPLLTHDSLMSIINALKDYSSSGTTYTIKLGSTNKEKLTAEELQIAQNKGWTVN